jgi:NAD(P)-dependent dehydrogenase (short-subunit alcohol dehydrogenase family)
VTPRFADRVAIVSGASSGIGLAVAERLGSEGARLVIVGAPADADDLALAAAALAEAGIEARALARDIGDPATAGEVVALAESACGRLDVLVNNAGTAYYEEALSTPLEHLDRVYEVNVRGTFAMSLAAARVMRDRGGGAIVNTASSASVLGEEFQVAYNASKGAVAALTRSLAIDLAPHRVRVNAVAPGWVRTRSTSPVLADSGQWAKHRSRIPLDRVAEVHEIAAVHAFLASDDAAYVTGAVYAVDGGLTAGLRYTDWAAVDPPPTVGIPNLPPTLGRPPA